MDSNLIIKVCGMRSPSQIVELASLDINYIGMIFSTSSPRYVEDIIDHRLFGDKKIVGVFINSPMEHLLYTQSRYQLHAMQLHGNESPDFCARIQSKGIEVIKAFSVDSNFDFEKTYEYDGYADFFLFDAKGDHAGGNGVRFDWSRLQSYEGATPFLLAGGIGPQHLSDIKQFVHPACLGIDINSRFETAPAVKEFISLKKFIHELRS